LIKIDKYKKVLHVFLIIFTLIYTALGIYWHNHVARVLGGVYPEYTFGINVRENSVVFSLIILSILVLYFIYKLIKGKRRFITLLYWVLFAELIVFFYYMISLHPIEIIHFLQYGSVTYLLGLCFDIKRKKFLFATIIFWGSVIGIFDEILQYYLINWAQKYLDINDFLVNVLGSIFGAMLYYGFKDINELNEPKKVFYKTVRFRFIFFISVLLIILFVTDYLRVSPPYPVYPFTQAIVDGRIMFFMERAPEYFDTLQKHFINGYFYNLGPISGISIIAAIIFIFSTFDPRFIQSIRKIFNSYKKTE
jgi:hypothetical protein